MLFYYLLSRNNLESTSKDVVFFYNAESMPSVVIEAVTGEKHNIFGLVISREKLSFTELIAYNALPANESEQALYLFIKGIGDGSWKIKMHEIQTMPLKDVVDLARKSRSSFEFLACVVHGISLEKLK